MYSAQLVVRRAALRRQAPPPAPGDPQVSSTRPPAQDRVRAWDSTRQPITHAGCLFGRTRSGRQVVSCPPKPPLCLWRVARGGQAWGDGAGLVLSWVPAGSHPVWPEPCCAGAKRPLDKENAKQSPAKVPKVARREDYAFKEAFAGATPRTWEIALYSLAVLYNRREVCRNSNPAMIVAPLARTFAP
jgi:hypothetical protein